MGGCLKRGLLPRAQRLHRASRSTQIAREPLRISDGSRLGLGCGGKPSQMEMENEDTESVSSIGRVVVPGGYPRSSTSCGKKQADSEIS